MTENYKLLTSRRTKVSYVGLWTRSVDNNNMIEVTKVDKNSPAAFNGLEVGDRITRIDGRDVKSMSKEISSNKKFNFRGYHPRNKKKTTVSLAVTKVDGRKMYYSFLTQITKENVKTQFAGTSRPVTANTSSIGKEWPANLPRA